ncbi:MAG: hypothetical protein U5O39_17145 [Gammaproteobacteria bacterium]|nr:hypothetical protein [Gammaproteobacteria bacterium]
MLLVDPGPGRMIGVLEGLLDGTYTREEVATWREGIIAEHGEIDLAIDDGFWYFESLAALTIPFAIEPDDEFFARRRDIEEYLLDLQRVHPNRRTTASLAFRRTPD